MRNEFAKTLIELAEKDESIVLIQCDIGIMFDEFKKRFPDRFFNFGICEQATIGMAAGMALLNLKPYIHTVTPFLLERAFEFIKVDVDLNDTNVKLVGASYPEQGPTHEEVDAKTTLSIFKNMKSYFPNNKKEVRKAILESYESCKPTFINLRRNI